MLTTILLMYLTGGVVNWINSHTSVPEHTVENIIDGVIWPYSLYLLWQNRFGKKH